ncbi:cysteine rich repeat-containing protein [Roseibium aggregatum]|uniref:Cysteine rich repeat-containing protein n=1 Tax=Roseibium aggregatum TaxID=187304 RepID=A0A939J089_9HYPH|nr:cysteine rich repeat-containing protein [Roseibium aggregatum]MBN9670856.1 cysteine rich repeat-containing protein [Roseibium aggregatum]
MTMQIRKRLLGILLAASCASAVSAPLALAQTTITPEMKAKARQTMSVCRADYQKFCANVPRGNGRILSCLNANMNQLQQACAAALQELPPPPGTN